MKCMEYDSKRARALQTSFVRGDSEEIDNLLWALAVALS